jgi:hypothetical protein
MIRARLNEPALVRLKLLEIWANDPECNDDLICLRDTGLILKAYGGQYSAAPAAGSSAEDSVILDVLLDNGMVYSESQVDGLTWS